MIASLKNPDELWSGTASSRCIVLDDSQPIAHGASARALCRFGGTWLQHQIETGELPPNGGTLWDQYIRALYWSFATLAEPHHVGMPESLGKALLPLCGAEIRVLVRFTKVFFFSKRGFPDFAEISPKS